MRRAPCVEFRASNARARLTGAIPRLRRGGSLRDDARTEFAACGTRRKSGRLGIVKEKASALGLESVQGRRAAPRFGDSNGQDGDEEEKNLPQITQPESN